MSFDFTISSGIHQEILKHCQASLPNEACGFLARDIHTQEQHFHPIGNDAASPRFFSMNPKEQLRAERAMEETGQQLEAIVHSHPLSEAFPSRTDLKQAHWPESDELIHPGIPWLIISLEDPDKPSMRVFLMKGDNHPDDIEEGKVVGLE